MISKRVRSLAFIVAGPPAGPAGAGRRAPGGGARRAGPPARPAPPAPDAALLRRALLPGDRGADGPDGERGRRAAAAGPPAAAGRAAPRGLSRRLTERGWPGARVRTTVPVAFRRPGGETRRGRNATPPPDVSPRGEGARNRRTTRPATRPERRDRCSRPRRPTLPLPRRASPVTGPGRAGAAGPRERPGRRRARREAKHVVELVRHRAGRAPEARRRPAPGGAGAPGRGGPAGGWPGRALYR